MSEKLSKDELLSQLELMRENLAEFSGMMMKFAHKPKNYPEILKRASEVREQAICQLKQLLEAQAENDEIHAQMIDIVLDLYEQLEARKPSEEFVKEQAERFTLRCPGFPPAQLDRLEDFVRNLIQERPHKILITHDYNAGIARGREEAEKPKVSKKWMSGFTHDVFVFDYTGKPTLFDFLKDKLEEAGLEMEK